MRVRQKVSCFSSGFIVYYRQKVYLQRSQENSHYGENESKILNVIGLIKTAMRYIKKLCQAGMIRVDKTDRLPIKATPSGR